MKEIHVRLRDKQLTALKAMFDKDINVSEIVRRAVDAFIRANRK